MPVEKAVETVENSANVEFIGLVWGWGLWKTFGDCGKVKKLQKMRFNIMHKRSNKNE